MLPKRSCTETDKGLSTTDRNLFIVFSSEFLLKCQLFSVRSLTKNPPASMWGITLAIWLDPVTTKFRFEGGFFAQAAPPAPGALSTITPGSMPAESEAFSSSASVRTTRDFALQLSWGTMAGHPWLEVKDLLLIFIGPDRLAGYGSE